MSDRPHYVFGGEVVDVLCGSGIFASGDSTIKKAISISTMDINLFMRNIGGGGTGVDNDYSNQAGMSFDGMFSPYTTAITHGRLPHFESGSSTPNAQTLNPWNPNNVLPTGDNRGEWMASGHNINFAVVGTGVGASGDPEDFAFEKDFFQRQRVETENIRAIGFRAPMVLTGWGFDTAGNPVPADPSDSTKFHPSGFLDPNLWKTGPVDLRWNDTRKVWQGGGDSTHYLVKTTNIYTPAGFSFEVQRSTNRSQYARPSLSLKANSVDDTTIHDPEKLAYDANSNNGGTFERLDWAGSEYPHYEAYIIRDTSTVTAGDYYNIWTDDCADCGHLANPCGSGTNTVHGSSSVGKKILIENPLRQALDVGDLGITINTGKTKKVNTGVFSGGSGSGAAVSLSTNSSGVLSAVIDAAGAGYTYGAFGIISGNICTNVSLVTGGVVTGVAGVTLSPTTGFAPSTSYAMSIYPNDSTADTELLPIHWLLAQEKKTTQIVSFVAANGGVLQTCTKLIQTDYASCEHCGEDSTLINNFL